jgi:hypothetical protein
MKTTTLVGCLIAALAAVVTAILTTGDYAHPLCTLFRINCPAVVVDGYISTKYAGLKQVFQNMFDRGYDIASCVAAYGKI